MAVALLSRYTVSQLTGPVVLAVVRKASAMPAGVLSTSGPTVSVPTSVAPTVAAV